jgi:multiple sugar transport system permease protein
MAQLTQPLVRNPARPALGGLLGAALLGALSSTLTTGLWSFLAVVVGDLDAALPLHWALLSGAGLGLGLGLFRRDKTTPWAAALLLGLAFGVVWLLLTGLRPLGLGQTYPFWGVASCLLSFLAAAQLTRYGLRDLNLSQPRRDLFEMLVLRTLRAAGFVFFLSVVIFPFYFMVVSSLKARAALLQNPTYLGVDLTRPLRDLLVGYREVLFTFDFLRYIGNSTFVALATVVITLVLAILGAYAVTRLQFPGRTFMSRSILLIYMFPAIILVIPLYAIFTQLGLRDTLPGLLIVYPATTIPVALYMLRSYFQTLPADLEEAGMIDGCTRLGVIWRITLPLSLPALASVGLYIFMIAWNEFLFAFMFLDNPDIYTLSRGMVALNSQEVPRQFLMAGAVIVTVPIMLIFFFFEKYLVGGLTAGGVKG